MTNKQQMNNNKWVSQTRWNNKNHKQIDRFEYIYSENFIYSSIYV